MIEQDGDLQSQAWIRLSKDELRTDILSGICKTCNSLIAFRIKESWIADSNNSKKLKLYLLQFSFFAFCCLYE